MLSMLLNHSAYDILKWLSHFFPEKEALTFSQGGGRGEGGGAGRVTSIYGIVRMCVLNGPIFQRCQVYDWPPFFDKKYMTGPIFLDWYMKGPTFSDIPVYAHIFHSEIFRLLVLLVFNELIALYV